MILNFLHLLKIDFPIDRVGKGRRKSSYEFARFVKILDFKKKILEGKILSNQSNLFLA